MFFMFFNLLCLAGKSENIIVFIHVKLVFLNSRNRTFSLCLRLLSSGISIFALRSKSAGCVWHPYEEKIKWSALVCTFSSLFMTEDVPHLHILTERTSDLCATSLVRGEHAFNFLLSAKASLAPCSWYVRVPP